LFSSDAGEAYDNGHEWLNTYQGPQLLQTGRAMFCAIEYFAKSLEIIGNGTIRLIAYEFPLAFHSKYGPILYHFRDIARF